MGLNGRWFHSQEFVCRGLLILLLVGGLQNGSSEDLKAEGLKSDGDQELGTEDPQPLRPSDLQPLDSDPLVVTFFSSQELVYRGPEVILDKPLEKEVLGSEHAPVPLVFRILDFGHGFRFERDCKEWGVTVDYSMLKDQHGQEKLTFVVWEHPRTLCSPELACTSLLNSDGEPVVSCGIGVTSISSGTWDISLILWRRAGPETWQDPSNGAITFARVVVERSTDYLEHTETALSDAVKHARLAFAGLKDVQDIREGEVLQLTYTLKHSDLASAKKHLPLVRLLLFDNGIACAEHNISISSGLAAGEQQSLRLLLPKGEHTLYLALILPGKAHSIILRSEDYLLRVKTWFPQLEDWTPSPAECANYQMCRTLKELQESMAGVTIIAAQHTALGISVWGGLIPMVSVCPKGVFCPWIHVIEVAVPVELYNETQGLSMMSGCTAPTLALWKQNQSVDCMSFLPGNWIRQNGGSFLTYKHALTDILVTLFFYSKTPDGRYSLPTSQLSGERGEAFQLGTEFFNFHGIGIRSFTKGFRSEIYEETIWGSTYTSFEEHVLLLTEQGHGGGQQWRPDLIHEFWILVWGNQTLKNIQAGDEAAHRPYQTLSSWRSTDCQTFYRCPNEQRTVSACALRQRRLSLAQTHALEDFHPEDRSLAYADGIVPASACLVIHSFKTVYVYNPKGASSTIHYIFEQFFNVTLPDKYKACPHCCYTTNCLTDTILSEYLFFTFVRHPASRFFSAVGEEYKRIAMDGNEFDYVDALEVLLQNMLHKQLFNHRELATQVSVLSTLHRHEKETGCNRKLMVPMDFVGKIEHFENDIVELLGRMQKHSGLPTPVIPKEVLLGHRRKNPGAGFTDAVKTMRNEAVDELIKKVYGQDFVCLGYDR